jgi:GNAT superfamily N-acetyltransferase
VITFREYEDADWEAVCRVHDLARPDELKGSCDARAFVPIERDPEVERLRRCRKLVALDGDRLVGFAGVDGTYFAWLYVDPDYYGRGIGRRLLRSALELTGPGSWTIVLEGNHRARGLYESEGFRAVRTFLGENAGYPCTGVRMERHGEVRPGAPAGAPSGPAPENPPA